MMFENGEKSTLMIKNKAKSAYLEGSKKGNRPPRVTSWPPRRIAQLPMGYFDGASQGDGGRCGAGAVILLPTNFTLKVSLMCGN